MYFIYFNKYPLPNREIVQMMKLILMKKAAYQISPPLHKSYILTGSLMNDFCREVVQVCKNLIFRTFTPIRINFTLRKFTDPQRKMTHPPKKLLIRLEKLRIRVDPFLLHQSDIWFICNFNHLINFLLNQVTQDQANCCIYSILGQLQNCPPDYSPLYFRRWRAHHFCSNIQRLWVKKTSFSIQNK